MAKYADCPSYFRDYLFYIQTIKGRSEKTVDGYYVDLKGFLKFLYLHKHDLEIDPSALADVKLEDVELDVLDSATLSDIYEYIHYVQSEKKNSAKTRARKISSIRSLYKYLTTVSHLIEHNPVKDLETPSLRKSLPKYLTLEESYQLLSSADGDYEERDYCILVLFLNCGMRLSELVGMNTSDIKGNQLRLLGKGNKERYVYLNDACLEAIRQYQKYKEQNPAKPKDKDAFFLSARGTRISNRRVEQIISSLLKKSQLDGKGYSVHKLRHTAATLMYQYGHVDIRILKEILGHANVGTTEIYTHVSDRQMEEAAEQSPLSHYSKRKQPGTALDPDEAKTEKEDKENLTVH